VLRVSARVARAAAPGRAGRPGPRRPRDAPGRHQRRERRGKLWRTTIADPAAQKRPDLVNREFTATAPDRLWVGDFTYLRTWEGRVHFAFLIDVFSRMIVGWQLASHMRTDLVLDALRIALGNREPGADVKLVAHTDQGSQYNAEDYTQVLDDHRVLASIGSIGDRYDNALAESFVDSYKTELIADRMWRTNAQLGLATVDYVGWFNHRRLHSSIVNRPPIEHEREYWARVALGFEPVPAQAAPTVTDLRGVVNPGLSARRVGAIALTDTTNYSTTNDSQSNLGKSKERERAVAERDRIADEREQAADHRGQIANRRERLADEREGTAEERERERLERLDESEERERGESARGGHDPAGDRRERA